jgi:Cys-tRNA(Pro)/Cys-tRNA(Cys) deacylase
MTPCIRLLKTNKTPFTLHQYEHDSTCSSYGEEAAQKLGVVPQRVFKTLVVQSDAKEFFVGIVPVTSQLSLKAMAKVTGAKKIAMADAKDVEKITGYVLGGVSPLGQKKRLKSVIDATALEYESIFVSAGKRGLEVELAPQDLQKLLDAKPEEIKL